MNETSNDYEFVVKDDGPGIDPNHQKNIFVIFQTIKKEEGHENSGIGLAIVKKIVNDNKGKIELESSLGNGSQFRFTWPKELESIPA